MSADRGQAIDVAAAGGSRRRPGGHGRGVGAARRRAVAVRRGQSDRVAGVQQLGGAACGRGPTSARHSGVATFHLAATDDGRIDAAEQVVACQHSGRRVLRQDLVACSVTGKAVLADFTETCSVSGRPALRHEFVACSSCRQRVSKAVLAEGECAACRGLKKVSKDDPRIAWILSEHAGLDRWSRWQLAETRSVYVAQASRLLEAAAAGGRQGDARRAPAGDRRANCVDVDRRQRRGTSGHFELISLQVLKVQAPVSAGGFQRACGNLPQLSCGAWAAAGNFFLPVSTLAISLRAETRSR